MDMRIVVLGENAKRQLVRFREDVYVRSKNEPQPDRIAGRWECTWQHFLANMDAYRGVGHNYVLDVDTINESRSVDDWDALVAEFLESEDA